MRTPEYFRIGVDEFLRLLVVMPTAATSEGRQAIDDAEVHHLRGSTVFGRHISGGTPKTCDAVRV